MLLTVSTTGATVDGRTITPTDLGFVLHKHPDNVRTVSTTAGPASVFWPEVTAERATMAMLVDVDPIGLVRRGEGERPLAAYVNDRAYVASSFLSVAIGRLFRSAMNGDCPNRPDLVDVTWPVTVRLPAVPVGGDPGIVSQLFGPLGYVVEVDVGPLDPAFPEWGPAPVASVVLRGEVTMRDLLRHLYVLLPVLDNDKHYWIDEAEVEKLLRHGDGWLSDHPEQQLITRRYLGNYQGLARLALDRLSAEPVTPDDRQADADEATIEKPLSLNAQRIEAVVAAVAASKPSSVVDLGCGEGNLVLTLAEDRSLDRLVAVDVSVTSLRRTERRLKLDRRSERQRPAIELHQSSLTYRDRRLEGFDVACLVEVIEHLDQERLEVLEPIVFKHYRPATVIVTTPNREYNPLFNMADGALRHRDHRFEWTRAEFDRWCSKIRSGYQYDYELQPIGPVDAQRGAPTQMAVLTKGGAGG